MSRLGSVLVAPLIYKEHSSGENQLYEIPDLNHSIFNERVTRYNVENYYFAKILMYKITLMCSVVNRVYRTKYYIVYNLFSFI